MKIYDKIDPAQYEARFDKSPLVGYIKEHWRPIALATISRYCKDKAVLDLGCGTGAYTDVIAQHANRVLGLDISKVMLGYAKNRHPNLEFAIADVHHTPLKNESIDTVVCIGVFEYIERTIVLEEINRVLKRDGIGVIMCPNRFSTVRAKNKLILKILGKEYLPKEPSYGEMLRLLKQKQFKIIASRMDDGLIYLPGFLDRLAGRRIFLLVEKTFGLFGRNPFSNEMLFVVKKGD